MYAVELMISGLVRQDRLLSELICELEDKAYFDQHDGSLYDEKTGQIMRNLRQLRQIKDRYVSTTLLGQS